jgi:hypothetical protein
MEALAAIQGGMSTMQQEVHSINLRVEQNQLDLRECLKFHHPASSDDEDDAPRTAPMAEDGCVSICLVFFFFFFFFLCLRHLVYFLLCLLNSWTNITLFILVLMRSLGGVIFVMVGFHYSILPFVPL